MDEYTKQRNRHVLGIRQSFESYIYEQRDAEKTRRIDELCEKNAELLHEPGPDYITPTFMYKGVMYKAWYHGHSTTDNKLIHPDILEEVIDTLNMTDFEVEIEEKSVMNYIGNVLIQAQHTEDLFALIPSRVQEPIQYVNFELFNIGKPMNETQLDTFRERNKKGLHSFKRLFLERLLLA